MIQPGRVENERADAGRDGLNPSRKTRSNPAHEITFSGANRDSAKNILLCSADHEQDWQSIHTVLSYLCE